jgi:hypothetical protein
MERVFSIPLPRIALCASAASCVLWSVSWSLIPISRNLPNCISARWGRGDFCTGFLSFKGTSSFFVADDTFNQPEFEWSERDDGHFCGFRVPPSEGYAGASTGLYAHFSHDMIAWGFPYWLMTLTWATVFARLTTSFRVSLMDLFLVTTTVAIVTGLCRAELGIFAALPLNLLTAALAATISLRAVRSLVKDKELLWPIAVSYKPATDIDNSPVKSSSGPF